MRVLAFDPGFERLGAAVLERSVGGKEVLIHSECIRTSATLPFPQRLALLGGAAEALIEKFKPEAVSLEDVYFAKNAKTAMKISEVRGMLTYITAARGLLLYQFTPLQVKVAITGYGQSDKHAVAMMVARLITLPPQILGEAKRLDDELDAIAVGLTCLASTRF